MTFSDVYEEWSKRKYSTVSESNVKGYTASYKTCSTLYNKVFKDIRLVDVAQYKDRNPNKYDRNKFEKAEIDRIGNRKTISIIRLF